MKKIVEINDISRIKVAFNVKTKNNTKFNKKIIIYCSNVFFNYFYVC